MTAPPASAQVPATSQPLLRRVPVGVWAALAWAAGIVSVLLVLVPLPGESPHDFHPGLDLPPGNLTTLWVAAGCALGGSVLLRRHPMTSLTLLLTGGVCTAMVHNSAAIQVPNFLACDIALWFVAATRAKRQAGIAAGLAVAFVVGYGAVRLAKGWSIGTPDELSVLLAIAVAVLLGRSARQSRDRQAEQAVHATEHAVSNERLRIARELHDMVAHTLGIVALQSGAARRVIDTQPARARDALGAVENASRETLAGLRRMLVVLRAADGPGSGGAPAPLHPAPGLDDLPGLAAATTAAGVRVRLDVTGERRPVTPEVELAAYRIVQESLTNVVRHAGAKSCQVAIGLGDEELSVEVADPGGARPDQRAGNRHHTSGYGLLGMRERVDLLGGEFHAGPHGPGFRVTARLPLAGTRT